MYMLCYKWLFTGYCAYNIKSVFIILFSFLNEKKLTVIHYGQKCDRWDMLYCYCGFTWFLINFTFNKMKCDYCFLIYNLKLGLWTTGCHDDTQKWH